MSRQLIYTGVLSGTLKRLKMLSLASCGAALTGTPILFALESSVSSGGRLALGSVALMSSLGSTGLIHFFTRPYIHKLYRCSSSTDAVKAPDGQQEYVAETLSILARTQSVPFRINETSVYHGARPFISFTTSTGRPLYCQRELLPEELKDTLAGNQE